MGCFFSLPLLIMTCIFWLVTYSTILLTVWKCRSVGAKFFLLFEERNRYQNLQSSVELNQFPSFNLICAACLVFLIEKFVNAVVPPWGGCFKENTWGWIVVSVISVTPIVFDSYRLSTGFSLFFLFPVLICLVYLLTLTIKTLLGLLAVQAYQCIREIKITWSV